MLKERNLNLNWMQEFCYVKLIDLDISLHVTYIIFCVGFWGFVKIGPRFWTAKGKKIAGVQLPRAHLHSGIVLRVRPACLTFTAQQSVTECYKPHFGGAFLFEILRVLRLPNFNEYQSSLNVTHTLRPGNPGSKCASQSSRSLKPEPPHQRHLALISTQDNYIQQCRLPHSVRTLLRPDEF
jgi:hypothetical protein